MWKKVLGLVAGMLAVVLLITGIMTAVNADSANTDTTAPAGLPPGPHPGRGFGPAMGGDMLEKVAARLNIDKPLCKLPSNRSCWKNSRHVPTTCLPRGSRMAN